MAEKTASHYFEKARAAGQIVVSGQNYSDMLPFNPSLIFDQMLRNLTSRHTLPTTKVSPTPIILQSQQGVIYHTGKTRVYRLHHIGTTSSYLCLEALRAGAKEAKQYHDLRLYEKVIGALREIHPDDHDAQPDQFWMEQMQKEVKAETDRLEQELRGYKNNLIKESIRVRLASSDLTD